MADSTGYRNPPEHTRFKKGVSGNPKGRPKGSQNAFTLLQKAGRQRISVTENGRTRELSKFEATILQLYNKAVRGEVRAITELRAWFLTIVDPAQTELPSPAKDKNAAAVIASVIERIRKTDSVPSSEVTDSLLAKPSPEDE